MLIYRYSYKQSLWAVQHAEGLFAAASLPFTRPDDYFAEMLKTDAHMSLIRQSLLNESAGIKASEDARKLRDAKKFGKKVQVERLKEREKEKKEVGKRLESLKKSKLGFELARWMLLTDFTGRRAKGWRWWFRLDGGLRHCSRGCYLWTRKTCQDQRV